VKAGEVYINGVSKRKVEKLAGSLGIDSIYRNRVFNMKRSNTLKERLLGKGPFGNLTCFLGISLE